MTTAEQLDPPYPGDESESEYQARRRKLLSDLTNDQIRDMVCDRLDYTMVDIIRRYIVMHAEPRVPEYIAVGQALSTHIGCALERYLEAHE